MSSISLDDSHEYGLDARLGGIQSIMKYLNEHRPLLSALTGVHSLKNLT